MGKQMEINYKCSILIDILLNHIFSNSAKIKMSKLS